MTALCPTDRVHITLMAHAIYKNVQLDADIFDTEKGGVDISKAVQAYYNKGSMKDLKDALRPVFNKLIGSEGDHFYGIKTKNLISQIRISATSLQLLEALLNVSSLSLRKME